MARNKKKRAVLVPGPAPRRPPTLLEYRGLRAIQIAQTARTLIKSAAVVGIAFFGWKSFLALAGEHTAVEIFVKVLGDIKANIWAAYLLGGGGAGYGLLQRRLRHQVNEKLGTRVSELEQAIDKRRTSSRLTPRGQTNPKDQ
jgi:hypothetical protein